jgi:hypothetical protein
MPEPHRSQLSKVNESLNGKVRYFYILIVLQLFSFLS